MNTNESIKNQVINDVIVAMSYALSAEMLQILEKVLIDKLVNVTMEKMNTLPVEIKNSVDEQNRYVIQLFLYKKKKLAKGTRLGYVSAVTKLVTLLYKPLVQMDEQDIFYYLDWYENKNIQTTGKKNQPQSVNNERRFLSAFFTWMRKEKLIAVNPVEAVEPLKEQKKPIDFFSPQEMAQLKDGCKTLRERALIEVLRSTGARVGEIVRITVDQINWETGDILILGEKSNRFRTIYLDPEALYHYKKYYDSRENETEHMFTTERKPYKRLETCTIRSIMKEVAARAGVTNRCYPHKMRKTLGMDLKNKGVDIGTIQEVMGHADSKVTSLYYAQSTADTLRIVRQRTA